MALLLCIMCTQHTIIVPDLLYILPRVPVLAVDLRALGVPLRPFAISTYPSSSRTHFVLAVFYFILPLCLSDCSFFLPSGATCISPTVFHML